MSRHFLSIRSPFKNPFKHSGLNQYRRFNWKKFIKKWPRWFLYLAAFLLLMFAWYSKDLPTPGKIKEHQTAQSTQIYDRQGKMLFAVSGEKKRLVLKSQDIPENLKKATIAVEDKHFYEHRGIRFSSIARALFKNIINLKIQEGGSTITQQYVKNSFLTSKRTFSRKIQEVILSLELEVIYSKDEILTAYLNEIPYGSNAYGAEAAAQTYFSKSAKELTLSEAAMLAALPRAPTYYSPYGPHRDELFQRKDFVLEKMNELSMLPKTETEKVKQEKIEVKPRRDLITAPHFVFWIKELLAEKYGEKMVDEGGLRVTTTLDLDIQRKAEEAVEAGSKKLDQYNANNAALVAIDPKRGQVVAMVGSKDYFNLDIDGNVNVTLSARQPGSAFKPIVYATAFKQKYNPAFTLFDLPTDFGGGYSPQNYDGNFRGPLSMRAALSNSLNIPAVKTLALAGVKNAIKTAEDLGITTLTDPNRYGLALVLGGGEVKPIELTNAFSGFVTGGKVAAINPILKIEDQKGEVLEEYPDDKIKTAQALDAQVAYEVWDILSDSEARKMIFGFTNALNIEGHKAAVKTGTTQEYRDAWTVGGTPALVTGVWVGNTRNEAMKKGADGSVMAAPIWNRFMTETMKTWGAEYPERPAGLSEIEVDKLSNKLPTADSPEIIRGLFASWQVPKEKDNVHIKVKVNKLNGKLATNDTPPELIEERLYTNIHSELPNSPGWENTVLEWAKGNGINNFPPTEKDDSYTSQNKPNISISAPKENANVQALVEIKAEATAGYGIDNVEFFLDNQKIGEKKEAPFILSFDFTGQSAGAHKLKAKVIDKNGGSGWHEINVNVPSDSSPPVISNISYFAAGSIATFHWTTSEPGDTQVEYGLTPALGAFSILIPNPTTDHTVELGGLQTKTTYFFRVRSKDAAGNLGLSGIYSLAIQ